MTAPVRWLSNEEWDGLRRLRAGDPEFTIPQPVTLRLRHLGLAEQQYGWTKISALGERILVEAQGAQDHERYAIPA